MSQSEVLQRKLHELYTDKSKHSVYQNIPAFVRDALGYVEKINERWRGDSTRWEYMRDNFEIGNEAILDVGANTGFFTLSFAHDYPRTTCTALEGNANHAEFIRLVAAYFAMQNVRVLTQYLDFASLGSLGEYGTILHYNVMHHAGVDFDRALVPDKDSLFDYLIRYMSGVRVHCGRVVFQMGSNWGGNKKEPIIDLQDDAGKIIYNSRFFRRAGWVIKAIATSYSRNGDIPVVQRNLPDDVLVAANECDEASLRSRLAELLDPAMNTFSEFYRRPIFVCTSD